MILHFEAFFVLPSQLANLPHELILDILFLLQQFQTLNVLQLQRDDLILRFRSVVLTLILEMGQIGGDLALVHGRVSLFDAGPVVVLARHGHGSLELALNEAGVGVVFVEHHALLGDLTGLDDGAGAGLGQTAHVVTQRVDQLGDLVFELSQ